MPIDGVETKIAASWVVSGHFLVQELQVERRVQSSREQEWEKQRLLQQEKIDLEEKVAELERSVLCLLWVPVTVGLK